MTSRILLGVLTAGLVLLACTGDAEGEGPSPITTVTTPTDPGGGSVDVPDGWTTHDGEGFSISIPTDWEETTERGDGAWNAVAPGDGTTPLVSVTAAETMGDASLRLDQFTTSIAITGSSFEEVATEEVEVAGASDALRREVTYPTGDIVVREYLVAAAGDGVDVVLRAAALDEDFAEASETLQQVIATLVVVPDTFAPADHGSEGGAGNGSETATT